MAFTTPVTLRAGLLRPGGAPARLPRLVGRGRALEIIAGASDFGGDLAERYGYVNRSVPDAQFGEFIDSFVTRLCGFDRRAIRELKRWIDPLTLPSDDEFPPQTEAFAAAVGRPEVQARFARLFEQGLQRPGDVENRLGEYAARS